MICSSYRALHDKIVKSKKKMFWRNGYQKSFADRYIKTYLDKTPIKQQIICALPKK